MPVTEMQWALRSPGLLHRNCPLDFISAVLFQLPFLYVNYYLPTFSLIACLFIQYIIMQLPHTGKKVQSCEGTDNTVRLWWCKNHTILGVHKIRIFLPFYLSAGFPTPSNEIRIFQSNYFTSACRFHIKTPRQMFVLSDVANSASPKGLVQCFWGHMQFWSRLKCMESDDFDPCCKGHQGKDMLTDKRSKAVKWFYKNKGLGEEIIFPTNSTLIH